MITRLELQNFTAFSDLAIDFSPRVNVIIGENGTGKTHLLKAAYGLCSGGPLFKNKPDTSKGELEAALTAKLLRLFMPLDDKLGKMRRHGVAESAQVEARFALDRKIAVTFHTNSRSLAIQDSANYEQYQAEPVFIPTKEVLSLVNGMTDRSHDQRTVELIFDAGYVDLAEALMRQGHDDPETKINLDPRFGSVVPMLVNLIKGRYRWENGGFCFQSGTYEETADPNRSKAKAAQMYQDSTVTRFVPTKDPLFSSGMTAEGFRKVGILHRLLSNGTLNPGISGPLFWDEPESNMNPKLTKLLVEILLELSRNGQQIILATHDYVLLKWFDLLSAKGKEDHVRFHALFREDGSGEVRCESVDAYQQLNRNAIAATFSDLYDSELDRSLGGQSK